LADCRWLQIEIVGEDGWPNYWYRLLTALAKKIKKKLTSVSLF